MSPANSGGFLRPALTILMAMTLLTGVAYPLAMLGLGQFLFPRQAAGSLVERDGAVIGSSLIGQAFATPAYFQGRPSATAPTPYNAAASSGSNLGPTNPALAEAVAERARAQASNGRPVPVDLLTASGSGLDPDISPAAARHQAAAVAAARGLDPAAVQALVDANTQGRQMGILGEPRVNVLQLNLALDARYAAGGAAR